MTRAALLAERVGFGAGVTGGTNDVTVTDVAGLVSALNTSGNNIILDASLDDQELFIATPVSTSASNLTIDGHFAPGVKIKPGAALADSSIMITFNGNNIFLNNFTLEHNTFDGANVGFSDPSDDNIGAMRFSGNGIYIRKVTATGFWEDAFDFVLNANNITISRAKVYNMGKAVHLWSPHSNDRSISIEGSLLAARERNPWNGSYANAHIWNTVFDEDPVYVDHQGNAVGRTVAQMDGAGFTQTGPANTISENNVYRGSNGISAVTAETSGGVSSLPGFLESVNDDIGASSSVSNNANVTYTSAPSLFAIPYSYTPLPVTGVEAYVAANAGAGPETGGSAGSSGTPLPIQTEEAETTVDPAGQLGLYFSSSNDLAGLQTDWNQMSSFTVFVRTYRPFLSGYNWSWGQISPAEALNGTVNDNSLTLDNIPDGTYRLQARLLDGNGVVLDVIHLNFVVGALAIGKITDANLDGVEFQEVDGSLFYGRWDGTQMIFTRKRD